LEKYTAVRVESYPLVTSARLISASSLRMLSATKLQRWRWSNGCIGACVFRVRSNGRADDRFAASLDEGPMGAAVLACGRFRVLRIRGGSLAGARRARVREGGGVATLRDQERERWRAAYLGRSGRRRRLAHSVECRPSSAWRGRERAIADLVRVDASDALRAGRGRGASPAAHVRLLHRRATSFADRVGVDGTSGARAVRGVM